MGLMMSPSSATEQHRHRRREPSIPKELRKEITQRARDIAKRYKDLFAADRYLKDRILRLEGALLPPRPRPRGRPRKPETTRAIVLYNRFRRQHPEKKPCEIWDHVCLVLYPEYPGLAAVERRDIRDALQARVKSRARSRRTRKLR
jgi:hypothetical protein